MLEASLWGTKKPTIVAGPALEAVVAFDNPTMIASLVSGARNPEASWLKAQPVNPKPCKSQEAPDCLPRFADFSKGLVCLDCP